VLDYVGGWPNASKVFINASKVFINASKVFINASKVFIGLHRDGLTGCPQANLSRRELKTLAEYFRIKEYTLFHCATGCSTVMSPGGVMVGELLPRTLRLLWVAIARNHHSGNWKSLGSESSELLKH
jgi:hypothetical protein